jgi:hypothetical protein
LDRVSAVLGQHQAIARHPLDVFCKAGLQLNHAGNGLLRKEIEMNVSKSCFGWKAESVVNLTDTIRLCIVTMKRYNGALMTTVTGSKREGDYWFYTVLQDFNKTVLATTPARVTQKTVEQQQDQAMALIDAIVNDASNFYKLETA